MTILGGLLRNRRREQDKLPAAVIITIDGSVDAAFSQMMLEMMRQDAIRIRRDRDDPDPPAVSV